MDVLLQNAMRMHQAGNVAEAMRLYRQVLRFNPRDFQALSSLAMGHFQSGEFEEAARLFGEAAAINPASSDVWYNRGCAFMALKRHAEAITNFDQALVVAPNSLEPLVNRAMALFQLGRVEEGVMGCDRALAIKPDNPGLLAVRAGGLMWLERYEEALATYDRILAMRPDDVEALRNRGDAQAKLYRYKDALASYGHALSKTPNDIQLLNNRAVTYFILKRYEEAIPDFKLILALDPAFEYAKGDLTYCKLQCSDWGTLEKDIAALAADVRRGRNVVSPLENIALSPSPSEQLQCARLFVAQRHRTSESPLWRGERYRHERIRVAYLSADFCAHPVGYQIAGVLEEHDRSRFHTVAFSYGPNDGSTIANRLRGACEEFVDVRAVKDAKIAALVREKEIDIAIDLMGFTRDARTDIFALRPAPVQAAYLGFPGTMGAHYIDYVIADRVVIPQDERDAYSEKVVELPHTYFPADRLMSHLARTATRKEAGLPETGFVFCCFNGNHKLMPQIFDIWMRLLRAIENAVLWLPEPNATAAGNLKREAEARGIAAERLLFAPFVARDKYIARLGLADLFLDTLPYGAHSTASDALAAGLPILTSAGTTFAGRVASSLLQAADMPELITSSLADYETLALRLAREPSMLAATKAKLLKNRDMSALFDPRRFARHLEAAFAAMWERQQRGEKPAHIEIAALSGLN